MPISNPGAKRQVLSSTYTANNTDARQIPTGFKCSLVLIGRVTTPRFHVLTSTTTLRLDPTSYVISAAKLHATDGFIVDATGEAYTNVGTETFHFWAIEE